LNVNCHAITSFHFWLVLRGWESFCDLAKVARAPDGLQQVGVGVHVFGVDVEVLEGTRDVV